MGGAWFTPNRTFYIATIVRADPHPAASYRMIANVLLQRVLTSVLYKGILRECVELLVSGFYS